MQRLSTGVYRLDHYLIWIAGCLCWMYNVLFTAVTFSSLRNAVLIACIYVLFLCSLNSFPDEHSIYAFITLVCCIGIVYCLQIFFASKYYLVTTIAVFIGCTIQLSAGLSQAYRNNWESLSVRGWFHNSGYFANYLAGIIPLFVAAVFKSGFKKHVRVFILAVLIAATFILVLTMARAALIGTIAGCVVLILAFTKRANIKRRMVIGIAAILIIPVGTAVLYQLRPASASGRLTIYEVSAAIIKDYPLTGVGPNRFSAVYNNYQSDYFKKENVPVAKELLADNTLEAFNSIIQVLTEYGIIGLLFLIWTVFQMVKRLKTYKESPEKAWLRAGSLACIASIFACSIFSNPLHVTPVLLLLVYHLSVVLPKSTVSLPAKRFYPLTVFLASSFSVFCCYYAVSQLRAESKWYKASEFAKYGNFADAERLYKAAYPTLKHNGDFLFNYGAETYMAGKYIQSIQLLERSTNYSSANNIYIYLGDAYAALNHFSLAEKNYLHAIYMVPSHIYPRYQLIQLYKKWNKPDLEKDWTIKTLEYPIKVRSEFVNDLIKELRNSIKN